MKDIVPATFTTLMQMQMIYVTDARKLCESWMVGVRIKTEG
jgi:hypothetical protein